jgi:hypothetical protein
MPRPRKVKALDNKNQIKTEKESKRREYKKREGLPSVARKVLIHQNAQQKIHQLRDSRVSRQARFKSIVAEIGVKRKRKKREADQE